MGRRNSSGVTLPPQAMADIATRRDPSIAPYIAASSVMQHSGVDLDEADEVLSTDTAEALREAAMKRADMLEEEDLESVKAPPSPMGLLAIHLLQMKEFDPTACALDLTDPGMRFKMMVSIGDIFKSTGLKRGRTKNIQEKDKTTKVLAVVAVDEVKHFSMRIPQQISDPNNVLKFELYGTSIYSMTRTPLELMGMVEIHIHEIIKAMFVIDVIPLSLNNRTVAKLDLEFAFMYGSLGFSYSTQLESPGFEPGRDLARCMFPRVALPENRDGEVLTPVPQHAPAFVPWTCPTITHWDETLQRPPSGPPPAAPAQFSEQVRGEVQKILADYMPITARGDRLAFLRKLIRGSPDPDQPSSDHAGPRPPSRPPSDRSDRSDRSHPAGPDQAGQSAAAASRPQRSPEPDHRPPGAPKPAQLLQNSPPDGGQRPDQNQTSAAPPAAAAARTAQTAPAAAPASSSSQSSPGGTKATLARPEMTVTSQISRASSNVVKISAPKHIRRVPWKRPAGSDAGGDETEEATDDSAVDTSVELL